MAVLDMANVVCTTPVCVATRDVTWLAAFVVVLTMGLLWAVEGERVKLAWSCTANKAVPGDGDVVSHRKQVRMGCEGAVTVRQLEFCSRQCD